LYVKYVNGATLNCHISRFSRNPSNQHEALASSEVILLTYNNQVGHLGGNLEFNNDGYLYFTTGDGAPGGRTQPGDEYGNSQNMVSPKGKLMRIDVTNGALSYPASNPHLINNDNIPDEIIGVGLRNPWKFSFDKSTGDLWLGDVGQDKYEEINFVQNGTFENANFGWSCYEGNSPHILANCPSNTVFVTPAYVYNGYNFNGNKPVSVTGGYVYRGSQYASLKGWYIFGDYATNDFWRTKRNPNGTFETIQLGKLISNPVAFGQDNNGEIYVASYSNGNIYKLKSTCEQHSNVENIHNIDTIVKVSDTINSIATVSTNVTIEYYAGKSISLMPGFAVSHTGVFKAQITACN
jgi:glucose/arabinose dehydrogenase